MSKRKKARIEQLKVDILDNLASMTDYGNKLVAFGGTKATREGILKDFKKTVEENIRLREELKKLDKPGWGF